MKSVLISINPKWCEKIASGKKTIEVRKTAPKEVPFKAYIYCTKGKDGYEWLYRVDNNGYGKARSWHGKVIGEFICDKVTQYNCDKMFSEYFVAGYIGAYMPLTEMCLTQKDLNDYGKGKTLYGLHISDLKIYEPKELSEFRKSGFMTEEEWLFNLYPNTHCHYDAWAKKFEITRPPQSWQFVEELKE